MKCSLGISNFLEAISSLSHSVVFLYFFALITEEGFLISPCYFRSSAFRWGYLSFSPLPLVSLFSAICKTPSDNHFAFLHFFFLGVVLIPASCTMSWAYIHSSSGSQARCLSDLIPWIYLSFLLYNHKEFYWRREWQTTSVFLPWEPHEQYTKAKRYDTERWTPQIGRCPICYWGTVVK